MTENVEDSVETTEAVDNSTEENQHEAQQEPTEDLDTLLEQYDDQVAYQELAQQEQHREPTIDEVLANNERLDQQEAFQAREQSAQQRNAQLEQVLGQVQRQELFRKEREDFFELVKEVDQQLDDIPNLPPRFVENWLLSAALQSPQLMQAWQARNHPQAGPRARKVIRGAVQRLYNEAQSSSIDPNATADRNAVIAWMRGASAVKVAEPPPKLGSMSDKEFQKFTEQFGF
jgi:hypothetical protein